MVRKGFLELDLILILILVVSRGSHRRGAKAFNVQLVVWILFGFLFCVGTQEGIQVVQVESHCCKSCLQRQPTNLKNPRCRGLSLTDLKHLTIYAREQNPCVPLPSLCTLSLPVSELGLPAFHFVSPGSVSELYSVNCNSIKMPLENLPDYRKLCHE